MSDQTDVYSINGKYVWPAHIVEKNNGQNREEHNRLAKRLV